MLYLCLVALASGLIPLAEAHNPASTLFEPVPLDDRLLVVGGEGTFAYLDEDATPETRGNLSGQGEVLGAPVVAGEQAAVVVRSFPDLVPHVQAFDEVGPSWRVEVGEEEAVGHVLPDGDGFTVFTSEARQLTLTADGEIEAEHELASTPATEPAPASQEGWWVPLGDGLARIVEGEVVDHREYTGDPTDVTVSDEHVLVSLTHRDRGLATLMVYDDALGLDWSRSLEGLRLGGEPAALGDQFVVGTYDPEGARIVALDASDGSITWERQLNATAAAPAAFEDRILAATTNGVSAYGSDGSPLWTHESQPYLDSPTVVEDILVPASAENRIDALQPNGTVAWTWSDGVEMPSWSHHDEAAASEEPPVEDEPQATSVLPSAALVGLLGLLALRTPRLRS